MKTNNIKHKTTHNSNQNLSMQTIGQLERKLSQAIQSLYRQLIGKVPEKVTCHCFEEKVVVCLEGSSTPLEEILVDNQQEQLANQLRASVNSALTEHMIVLTEEVLEVPVLELLIDTSLQSGRTGLVVCLSQTPSVRNPRSIPKHRIKAESLTSLEK